MSSIKTSTSTPVIASSVPSSPSTAALRSASKPASPVTKLRRGLPSGPGSSERIVSTSLATDSVSSRELMTVERTIDCGSSAEKIDGAFSGPSTCPTSPQAMPPGPETPLSSGRRRSAQSFSMSTPISGVSS